MESAVTVTDRWSDASLLGSLNSCQMLDIRPSLRPGLNIRMPGPWSRVGGGVP
jgi:hypothetical protein